jgi:hypothetical protein
MHWVGHDAEANVMAHRSQSARIIAHSSPPDLPQLRAIAKEVYQRARGRLMTTKPRPDSVGAELTAIRTMTLLELCREAIEALGPESRKLHLGRNHGTGHADSISASGFSPLRIQL